MKKKVCIFTSYFPLVQGGAEYQAYLLAQSLTRQKFEVFFLSFNQGQQELIKKDGYKIYSITTHKSLSKFGNPYFLYYFKIKKILSNEKPDIIYRRMGSAIPGILCLLKNKLNFTLFWACAHINDVEKYKICGLKNILNNFDNLFRIYGIKHADKILVQTNQQKQLLLKNFRRTSILFPNVHPAPESPASIIKDSTAVRIVWIANFKKWKQAEMFIKLADQCKNLSDTKFIMVGRIGSGKYGSLIKNRIQTLSQVEYKGEMPIHDVNQLLTKSHIFVNTSLYEGFPNTFIQAWMRKLPVISLHVDPDDIIKTNRIGFHSGTFGQMVKDTKFLIEKHEIRENMGTRAQSYSLKKFSLNNLIRLTTLFENL